MGFKRPFDEDFEEFSVRPYPKQIDCGNRVISFADVLPPREVSRKLDDPFLYEIEEAEDITRKTVYGRSLENDIEDFVSDSTEKEFKTSSPLSWVTSFTSEEDVGLGAAFCPSLYPEYFDFNLTSKTLDRFEDSYSCLLNSYPRKVVPIGSNYQAEIPPWDPTAIEKQVSITDGDREEELSGTCFYPLPELQTTTLSGVVECGRTDCSCSDEGSFSCVRQHVKEAREKLRETLGHKQFVDLGLCDMGEEVANKWTEEEERDFHEVVYSYPVSLDKNFWEQLLLVFPSRSKKELVSYYFNVFMLRKRAFQNRYSFLEIDSDDDEWQGDVQDAALSTSVDQNVSLESEDESVHEDGEDSDKNKDDDDHDGDCHRYDDGDVGVKYGGGNVATGEAPN